MNTNSWLIANEDDSELDEGWIYQFLLLRRLPKLQILRIPVPNRKCEAVASVFEGTKMRMDGLYTIPLEVSFGNHRFYDITDHVFKVIKLSYNDNVQIPAQYVPHHNPEETHTWHWWFPQCVNDFIGHGNLYPQYKIQSDTKVAERPYNGDIGANNCYGGILSPSFNTTFIRLNTAAYLLVLFSSSSQTQSLTL